MRTWLLGAALLVAAGGASDVRRFPPIPLDQMDPAQRKIADAILAGPRHSIEGPFNAWLRSPELADRLQKVGEYLRFETSLPHKLNELAILITGREWGAGFEWYAHEPLAIKAGLEQGVADQLREGKRPEGMSEDEALVYDFCTQLLRQHQVSDAAYQGVVSKFGERGATDLIGVTGYYVIVSMTLNVAQVEPPEGAPPTVPPPELPR
jgi:4-carboxymuconolactone decarboxylase